MLNGSEKDMMPIDKALGTNQEEPRGAVIATKFKEYFEDTFGNPGFQLYNATV